MKKLLSVLALGLIASSAFSQNMPKDAVLLGERTVDFHATHDVISVGRYEGAFRDIAFWVERNNIEIFGLVVTYENGERQNIDTRLIFDAGTRSRTIHVEGERRRIRSIAFTFKTVGIWLFGKARVVVYGLR